MGRLSATKRVRRWVVGKPKLAADVTVVTGEKPDRPNLFGVLFRLAILCVSMAAVVAAGCWIIFGMTVMPLVRAGGENWLVRTGAWTQGQAPTGTPVFVLPDPVQRDALSKAVRLISPSDSHSIVTVLAHPGQKVVTTGKTITVDGMDTGVPANGYTFVDNGGRYLAVCQIGACGKEGEVVTVPVNKALGQVLRQVTFTGLKPPPSIEQTKS